MDMARLYELQKLDVNLEKARRKLAQLQQALGESEELEAARKDGHREHRGPRGPMPPQAPAAK